MVDPKGVKRALYVVCAISVTLASCQDVVQKNETKTVDLQDPAVDGTVKSALENGSVSEVVVRKDLLLFPVNAPNLVIAHRQEIHAVPQTNGSNETDGKPTGAQVAEVNEYSLSQLVSTNDTDNQNETGGGDVPISSSPFSSDTQNSTVLAAGKLLEIPSGFNLTDGLATERVALPDAVQNVSIPKQSIVDILSKSLAQQDTTVSPGSPPAHGIAERSVEPSEYDGGDGSDSDVDESDENATEAAKRSAEADESSSAEDDTSGSSTTSATEGSTATSTTTGASTGTSATSTEGVEKRSAEAGGDGGDDSKSSTTTEYYDSEVPKRRRVAGGTASSGVPSSSSRGSHGEGGYPAGDLGAGAEEGLRDDEPPDDMDAAEDIVFRPLFRYRQETQLRRQSAGGERRRDYNGDDYGNNGDYD